MKKTFLTAILTVLVGFMCLAGCSRSLEAAPDLSLTSSVASNADEENKSDFGKVLIVYYSFSGNTLQAANEIKEITGGDIFEIVPDFDYNRPDLEQVGKKQVADNYKPKLKTSIENIASYDTVFVGSPVWWFSAAPPVMSFLSEYDLSNKTVIPFWTYHSADGDIFNQFKEACSNSVVIGGGGFTSAEAKNPKVLKEKVGQWLKEIAEEKTGNEYSSFDYNGTERKYIFYLPEKLKENAPLVFVLHGYTSNALEMVSYTNMNQVADEHGFAVVYPQGLVRNEETHWNADLTFSDVDDTGFLVALAEFLQNRYNLSSENTFATGHSNGGFMCYKLACDAPEIFRAVASVEGLMSGATWNKRNVSQIPVSVLQIHGTGDTVVPIDGTMSLYGGWGGAPELSKIIDFWKEVNNAHNLEKVAVSDKVTAYRYSSNTNNNLVWYYIIDDYPHIWPGARNETEAEVELSGLEASELVWEFFSTLIKS